MPALEAMITEPQLAALRAGFDNALMVSLGNASLSGPIPQAAAWVESTSGYFYATDRNMGPTHRELCVISTLTAMRCPDELAIHVYWGLVVGLSVDQVADAIFLGGNYGGVSAYNTAVKAARTTIVCLASLAAAALAEAGAPEAAGALLPVTRVVPAIGAALRSSG